jgi:hypothetical protein
MVASPAVSLQHNTFFLDGSTHSDPHTASSNEDNYAGVEFWRVLMLYWDIEHKPVESKSDPPRLMALLSCRICRAAKLLAGPLPPPELTEPDRCKKS